MSQDKAAEIIDFKASRGGAPALAANERAGAFLAAARRAAGLSLEAVSADIKVKISHLEAIEESRPDKLPATPYAVGFIKAYARHLGLDEEAIAARFKDEIAAAAPAPIELTRAAPSPAADIGEGVRMISIFGIVAILIFATWIAFQIIGHQDPGDGAPPQVTLTQTTPPQRAPKLLRQAPAQIAAPEALQASPQKTELIAPVSAPPPVTQHETPPAPAVEEEAIEEAAVQEAEPIIEEAPAILPAPEPVRVAPQPLSPSILPAPEALSPPREDVVVTAKLTRSIAPKYPDRCDRGAAQLETVTVIFDVTAAGRTANVRILSSTNACFEQSALRTIDRWRFNPKTVGGAVRPDIGRQATLNFRR